MTVTLPIVMLRKQPNRPVTLLFIALFAMFTLPAVASGGAITVTRVSGSVKVLVGEKPIAVSVGGSITPPARIETGADGSLRIEQASSNLDIGPNSVLLIPGTNAESENIIQNLGRVLYSVKPRKSRSFSVQTPYLVSVVKGTVFSVAIENDATLVSLMEGSVELVADGVAPVLLLPNDTARRGEHDRSISVTKMDVTAPATVPQAAALGSIAPNAMTASAPAMIGDAAIAADLNEITAAHRDPRSAPVAPESPLPSSPPAPAPPSAGSPQPEVPTAPPTPEQPTTPVPDVPTQPEVPAPNDDDDHGTDIDDDHHHDDDDASTCTRKKCDSDDDHDRGGGNDRR